MTDDIAGFEFTDTVPEQGNPVTSDDLACVTCGKPLIYSGHGRKPKYCDEHKRATSAPKKSGRNGAVVDRAIDELTALYGYGGQITKFKYPDIGEHVYQNREKLAESYRLLLESNARFRKLFQQWESKAAWLPILIAHGDVISAIWFQSRINKLANDVPDDQI